MRRWIYLTLLFFCFAVPLFGEVEERGSELADPDVEELLEVRNPLGPPPFLLDFTTSPFPFARSYVTGYLGTADSHTLPPGKWRSGVVSIGTFWSYKILNSQVDANYVDNILLWGVGIYKGVELSLAMPVRYYYGLYMDDELVDLQTPFSLYDSAINLKAVYKGEYAAVGFVLNQIFPVGIEQKGFGSGEFVSRVTGILSFTPFPHISIDGNVSYYFGGDGPGDQFFDYEGLVIHVGAYWELGQGFALACQGEYWNPFVPTSSKNSRFTASLGLKVQTTETGAVFFGLGYSLKKPELAPSIQGVTVPAQYDEDYFFYLSLSFMEHW